MMNALLEHYGTTLSFDGEEVTLWPLPDEIAGLDPSELRTTAKIGYRVAYKCIFNHGTPLFIICSDRGGVRILEYQSVVLLFSVRQSRIGYDRSH
jgi:hypothetical protein